MLLSWEIGIISVPLFRQHVQCNRTHYPTIENPRMLMKLKTKDILSNMTVFVTYSLVCCSWRKNTTLIGMSWNRQVLLIECVPGISQYWAMRVKLLDPGRQQEQWVGTHRTDRLRVRRYTHRLFIRTHQWERRIHIYNSTTYWTMLVNFTKYCPDI